MQRLWVPGRLPGMNEILNLRGAARGRGNPWAKLKEDLQHRVALNANSQGIQKMQAAHFTYLLVEHNKQRDPSNILAGAVKIIEDALVSRGFLPNDGWGQILGIQGHWATAGELGKECVGVVVYLGERCIVDKGEVLELEKVRRR